MPAQKPRSSTSRIVCSSTWSTSTRLRSIRRSPLSMSRIIRVPWYLSSRCGVWIRICSLVFIARSTCSRNTIASLRGVLVQADLADAQHAGRVEELGDHGDHLARQADVLGLLGVDAQPGVMPHAVPAGPLGLELGQLAEVIAKAVDGAAIEAGPEGRLAHGDAAHLGQRLVVVGDARDHVDVRIDVIHGRLTRLAAISKLSRQLVL